MAIIKKYAIYDEGKIPQYYFIRKLSEKDFLEDSGMTAGYYGTNLSSELMTGCCPTIEKAEEKLFQAIPEELKEERKRLREGIENLEGRVRKIDGCLKQLCEAKSPKDFEVKEE